MFTRLPERHHAAARRALLIAAAIGAVAAVACTGLFLEDTKTTGALWFKTTRTIPLNERVPALLGAIAAIALTLLALVGALELVISQERRREAENAATGATPRPLPVLLVRSAWAAHKRRQQADQEARDKVGDWFYARSPAGRAETAWEEEKMYFSVEIKVDGRLGDQLEAITDIGWRIDNYSRRHRKTSYSSARPDGGHDVTRTTTEYRTYLFHRPDEDR